MSEKGGGLVSGRTQARKTKLTFQVIQDHIVDDFLCLFVCQANNVQSSKQTYARAKETFLLNYPIFDATESTCVARTPGCDSAMFIGYWHTSVSKRMLKIVKRRAWKKIMIVIDESDQGGVSGTLQRLRFVDEVAFLSNTKRVYTLFVTATVANMSKSINEISKKSMDEFRSAYVRGLLSDNDAFEHHSVEQSDDYVGASWFVDHNMWQKLDNADTDYLCQQLSMLPQDNKRLTLIAANHRTTEHHVMCETLFSKKHMTSGYNVVVEMNSTGKTSKNYNVTYQAINGVTDRLREWCIPYTQIENDVLLGKARQIITENGEVVSTGIKNDTTSITLSHVLCACLFIGTNYAPFVKGVANQSEWFKVIAIYNLIKHLRPSDYPMDPYVAIISGNMVGRGLTIQSALAGFVCTSFCFTDTNNGSTQRGAQSAQRVGRACGLLKEAYQCLPSPPILLATEKVMQDAIANEKCTLAQEPKQVVALSSLVGNEDWCEFKHDTNNSNDKQGRATTAKPSSRSDIVDRCGKPKNGVYKVVTDYESFSDIQEFIDKYMVDGRQLPETANKLAKSLKIPANVSYKKTSAAMVSDLRNYFKYPMWASKPYHIMYDKDANKCIVIKRDVSLLSETSLMKGMILAAHDERGMLCYYLVKY